MKGFTWIGNSYVNILENPVMLIEPYYIDLTKLDNDKCWVILKDKTKFISYLDVEKTIKQFEYCLTPLE